VVKLTAHHPNQRQLFFTIAAVAANADLRSEQSYVNDVPVYNGKEKSLCHHPLAATKRVLQHGMK
jgi:hypothetical protein